MAYVTPKKSLGQNFLMHRQIASRIVLVAGVTTQDVVLEIGPGTGMLTKELLKVAKKVIAVEADHELIGKLEQDFASEILDERFELISGDIRSFDPSSIEGEYLVVANIPYYLTGELIRGFLTATHPPKSLTFLVQKEVAERIARSKKESLLSLSVKTFGNPHYRFTVPKGAFFPAPSIDSAVLSITDIHSPFADKEEGGRFFDVLHAAFAHKRKQLAKNLEEIFTKDSVERALLDSALARTIRAEDIPLGAWKVLTKNLVRI